jgi:hypothetical protein
MTSQMQAGDGQLTTSREVFETAVLEKLSVFLEQAKVTRDKKVEQALRLLHR